jgi:hypothetical protein
MSRELKADLFWYCFSFAFVVGLSLGGFMGAISKTEHPIIPTYRIEIKHVQPPTITEAEIVTQAVYPIPPSKRRPIEEQLSPETIRAIELETAKEIFNNGRDPFEGLK